jgi:hypothetical protein
MSKKRKTPASSSKSTRKTEAPKRVSRVNDEQAAAEVTASTATTAPASTPTTASAHVVTEVAPTPPGMPAIAISPATPELVLDRTQVARLAFAKFAARGYVHGHHVEDWFAAERELRAARQ